MGSKIGVSGTTGTTGTTSAGTATGSAAAVKGRTVAHTKNTVKIKSVHEHIFVPTIINEMEYFRCITCGTVYCQLFGKSLDASATQNHQVDKFERNKKVDYSTNVTIFIII
jgi:hypothetical protein